MFLGGPKVVKIRQRSKRKIKDLVLIIVPDQKIHFFASYYRSNAQSNSGIDTMKVEIFNSKLLLFGEYGLMFNAMALSIPFSKFSGYLELDASSTHVDSSSEIKKFYEHLKIIDSGKKLNFLFDLVSLKNDLAKGLFFNSNIPQQYGVGSSGALVAALFSKYAAFSAKELNPELLKADFAILESFFHGQSSGLDPLISFLNKTLLIDTNKAIQTVQPDLAQPGFAVALIDTKTTGATGPLVQHFINLYSSPQFKAEFENRFLPANNNCIESLLNGNQASFFISLNQLVRFQLEHFSRMIPEDFHSLISFALDEKVFIKLLGSGGGGFLLVFAESENAMRQWADKHRVKILMITKKSDRKA